MKIVTPKVGQVWIGSSGARYTIIAIDSLYAYDLRPDGLNGVFSSLNADGKMNIGDYWILEGSKPRKIIPDIPLDPSLPILQAGHLQDRARKKYR